MQAHDPISDPLRDALHRSGNYATLCLTHAQAAVESGDHELMRRSLEAVLAGSNEFVDWLVAARSEVVQARMSQEAPASSVGL